MTSVGWRSRGLTVAAGLAFLVALPAAASGAYPGTNGKIVFDVDEGNGDIKIANPDGSDVTNLTPGFGGGASSPAFSPDGTRIAFLAEGALWTVNPDGSELDDLNLAFDAQGGPTWSPDGTKIAVSATLPGETGGTFAPIGLKIVNSSSGALLDTLTPPDPGASASVEYLTPAWNPVDPGLIAVSQKTRSGFNSNFELALVPTNGNLPTPLTADSTALETAPDWAPDASKLIFSNVGATDAEDGTYSVPAAGGVKTRLTIPPDPCPDPNEQCGFPLEVEPFFSPDGLAIGFGRPAGPSLAEGIFLAAANGSNPQLRFGGGFAGSWGPESNVMTVELSGPSKVKKNKKAKLKATIGPCPEVADVEVSFSKKAGNGFEEIGTDSASGPDCKASLSPKVKKKTTFRATTEDAVGYLGGTSDKLTVKIKK